MSMEVETYPNPWDGIQNVNLETT